MTMAPVKAIVIGAGYRGRAYAAYAKAHPDELEIVGVADPTQAQIIHAPAYWEDWRDCLAARPDAALAIICTPDALHHAPALAALRAGYHLILEKPISPTEAECREVVAEAHARGRLVMVGHILRHTRVYATIKAALASGELGDVVSIAHQESMGYWKAAHSYCRGSWANAEKSSPIILAKCSHDFDLFAWWVDKPVRAVSSFGSILEFRRERMPPGAAERCLDCPAAIADRCVWNARRLYVEQNDLRYLFADPSREAMLALIRTSPYGRCVYACDNDVPDHQSVMIAFEGGAVATHMMTGFTTQNARTTIITCTRGEIRYDGRALAVSRFDGHPVLAQPPELYRHDNPSRHDGGDFNLVAETLRLLREGTPQEIRAVTEQALQSHLICFAAERSRLAHGAPVQL